MLLVSLQALKRQVRNIRHCVMCDQGNQIHANIDPLEENFKSTVMKEIRKIDRVFFKTERECWSYFFIELYPRYLEVSLKFDAPKLWSDPRFSPDIGDEGLL
jgi:hypothetical protein